MTANTAYGFLLDFIDAGMARMREEHPDCTGVFEPVKLMPPEAIELFVERNHSAFAWLAQAKFPPSFYAEAGEALGKAVKQAHDEGRHFRLVDHFEVWTRAVFNVLAKCQPTEDDYEARPYLRREKTGEWRGGEILPDHRVSSRR